MEAEAEAEAAVAAGVQAPQDMTGEGEVVTEVAVRSQTSVYC